MNACHYINITAWNSIPNQCKNVMRKEQFLQAKSAILFTSHKIFHITLDQAFKNSFAK